VPFGDSAAIGTEIAALLTDDLRDMLCVGRLLVQSSNDLATDCRRLPCRIRGGRQRLSRQIAKKKERPAVSPMPPQMNLTHFRSMCDATGLFQHAIHSVPDRSHGYCVDDNARALLLACALNVPGEERLGEELTAHIAAFVQHSWNPVTRRFRNFMSFDRRWLEDSGSEDSHGRALWALGECARSDVNASRRRWQPPCSPKRFLR